MALKDVSGCVLTEGKPSAKVHQVQKDRLCVYKTAGKKDVPFLVKVID